MSSSEPIVSKLTLSLLSKFQRDLHRANDSDRNTRKRGLQKLLEDLPWGKKSQREELKSFVSEHMLKILLVSISDEVEKCRELSLQILKKCLEKCTNISFDSLHELTVNLCGRISEVPFPEPAEEVRLSVLEVLVMVKNHRTLTGRQAKSKVADDVEEEATATSVDGEVSHNSIVVTLPAETRSALSEKNATIDEKIVQMLVKSLGDNFPNAKRTGGELLISICNTSPYVVRSYYKQLLKPLLANAGHQHSKTRTITLQAIGKGLSTLGLEDYQTLLKEPILSTILRTVSDRTASVRTELAGVCADILVNRIRACLASETMATLQPVDFELFVVLFLLHGDPIEEVAAESREHLFRAVRDWQPSLLSTEVDVPINGVKPMDVEDGELTLRDNQQSQVQAQVQQKEGGGEDVAAATSTPTVASLVVLSETEKITRLCAFVAGNLASVLDIMQDGVQSWTTDSRKRYLHGLECLIRYTDISINFYLAQMLSLIGAQVRDEDPEVRDAAEKCCRRLGYQASAESILEILLPRASGAVAGGDTATLRAQSISVLTNVLKGLQRVDDKIVCCNVFGKPHTGASVATATTVQTGGVDMDMDMGAVDAVNPLYLVTMIATCLSSDCSVYAFREASLRESLLLLVRTTVAVFQVECQTSAVVQQAVLLALCFLCARCPGEDDVVSEIAQKELRSFTAVCMGSSDNVGALVGTHYRFLLYTILAFQLPVEANKSFKFEHFDASDVKNSAKLQFFCDNAKLLWESDSISMAAFSELVRLAPFESWAQYTLVLPVVINLVQPKQAPAPGSAEANMLSYAAQRGNENRYIVLLIIL
jgi:hypothetical protein